MAHIQKRGPGRYKARYRDPAGKERSKTFARQIDAKRFLTSVEGAKLRGEWTDPRLGRTPFREWKAKVGETQVGRRESTIVRDESVMRNMVLPAFGSTPLASIDSAGIKAWVSKLSAQGKAPATVRKAYQLLAAVLEEAVDVGMIPRSPCRKIPLPRSESHDMHFLSSPQVALLADSIDPRYRALVLAGAYTGLRIGELTALRTSRIDFLRRSVRVEETLNEVRGHLRFGQPKTKASRRTVSIPAALGDTLDEHLTAYPAEGDDLVFTAPEGGPFRRSAFRRRTWIPALEAASRKAPGFGHWIAGKDGSPEFVPAVRIHDLRHTHAALLVAQGVHPKVLQERLGHSSIRTTLDTYGHLFDGLDEAAAEGLDLAFREAAAAPRRPEAGAQVLTLAQ
ncbi:MAG: tyrosine-type recombinase/integrase [Actinomycetota bacterium]